MGGYPPVVIESNNYKKTLFELGIDDGDTIILEY
jgi:hypothetical protein